MNPQASNSIPNDGKEEMNRLPMNIKSPKRTRLLLSLRAILTVPNVLLIFFAIVAVGIFSFQNGKAAVNDAAHQFRRETAIHIHQRLVNFLEVPVQINEFNAKVIQSGELDPTDTAAMQRFFLEEAKIHPSISSIYFGNTDGGLIGGGREGAEGWLYVTSTVGQKSGEFQKFKIDETGQISPTPLASIPNFDARLRPWYARAKETENAAWSDIYILFTGQDMALAASRPVYNNARQLMGVVSVDIFLSQLSDYLASLSVNSVGQVFIMERSGALVASSNGESLFQDSDNDGTKNRVHVGESKFELIRETGELLAKTYGTFADIPHTEGQLEFKLGGEKQFVQHLSVSDPYGINWLVVIIIPESAFMERIEAGNRATLFTIVIVLCTAIILSITITARISRRISHLGVSAQKLSDGEWTHELDTSTHITELKRLALSFDQMKAQLGTTLEHLTREVKERQRAEQELETTNRQLEDAIERERQLARIDELTGAHNRRHLFEVGAQKIAVAHRYRQPLAALMIDIDHFKNLNDQHGHILGDKILKQVAMIASDSIRRADIIGRYGGEEFIVIMPMTAARQAYLLAERIRAKVEKTRFHSERENVSITLSVGVAELNSQIEENIEDLFHHADEAMYAAKRAGRNQSAIYKNPDTNGMTNLS